VNEMAEEEIMKLEGYVVDSKFSEGYGEGQGLPSYFQVATIINTFSSRGGKDYNVFQKMLVYGDSGNKERMGFFMKGLQERLEAHKDKMVRVDVKKRDDKHGIVTYEAVSEYEFLD
jgi:hypothetical protein